MQKIRGAGCMSTAQPGSLRARGWQCGSHQPATNSGKDESRTHTRSLRTRDTGQEGAVPSVRLALHSALRESQDGSALGPRCHERALRKCDKLPECLLAQSQGTSGLQPKEKVGNSDLERQESTVPGAQGSKLQHRGQATARHTPASQSTHRGEAQREITS